VWRGYKARLKFISQLKHEFDQICEGVRVKSADAHDNNGDNHNDDINYVIRIMGGLLMPSLSLVHLLHKTKPSQAKDDDQQSINITTTSSASGGSKINDNDSTIMLIITQCLTKLEQIISSAFSTSQSDATNSSNNNSMASIVIRRRILHHILSLLQLQQSVSSLHTNDIPGTNTSAKNQQSMALLRLMNYLIIPPKKNDRVLYDIMMYGNHDLMKMLTKCCQLYYTRLALSSHADTGIGIGSKAETDSEAQLEQNQNFYFHVTIQLIQILCRIIPSSFQQQQQQQQRQHQQQMTSDKNTFTASTTIKTSPPFQLLSLVLCKSNIFLYLSSILLSVDLQPIILPNTLTRTRTRTRNIHQNKQYNTHVVSCLTSVIQECAIYLKDYYSNNSNDNNNDSNSNYEMDDNELMKRFVCLLFISLGLSLPSSSSLNNNMNNTSHEKHQQQQTILNMDLITGHEILYIQNAFQILQYIQNEEEGTQKKKMIISKEEQTMFYHALIHFLSLILYQLKNNNKNDVENHPSSTNSSPPYSNNNVYILNVLIALIAKGEDVTSIFFSKSSSSSTMKDEGFVMQSEEDNDNDDEEDSVEMEEDSNDVAMIDIRASSSSATTVQQQQQQQRNVQAKRRGMNSYQYKRQDLQTISKIDQLYQSKVQSTRRDVVSYVNSLQILNSGSGSRNSHGDEKQYLYNIANKIGNGEVLSKFASVLFTNNIANTSLHFDEVHDTFVTMLSNLLSYCSGIKSRSSAMSPLLSKLAFQSKFMEQLWSYVCTQLKFVKQKQKTQHDDNLRTKQHINIISSTTLFCDLFVHQLLAMDDEEFLLSYTTKNSNGKRRSSIDIIHLIEVLKSNLYDLYWGRPVIVSDVILQTHLSQSCTLQDNESCQRVRLLLSGTKLWNTLYQRWSRLSTTAKFCEQELWHFPRLVTRGYDEDGAVFGTMSDSAVGGVDMDVDDGDANSTSSMDIDDSSNNISIVGAATVADEENDALASSFKDPKMARILTSIPQVIPFHRRVRLFKSLLTADLSRMQDETQAAQDMMRSMLRGEEDAEFQGRVRVEIRREHLYQDAMDQLNNLGPNLRKKVQVTLYNQVGAVEAGIDGGGVFREFLDDLIKEAFHPETDHGHGGPLFSVSPLQTLKINTSLTLNQELLSHYQFLGRVLGKAVYESVLVEPQFCLPFLNQLLGQQNTLDDLKNFDPEYYKHLSALRKMDGKDIDMLGLTFELSTQKTNANKSHTVELIPGGSSMSVTKENAIRYVHLVAHRRLNMESNMQTGAFLRGFRDVIPAAWVRLFSPSELQRLIGGDDRVKGFDVKGLMEAMVYGGGYHPSQCYIQWFWEIVVEMTPDQQRKFLKFMTSCSRQPLLGFRSLTPLPCIHQIRLSNQELQKAADARLPTSATCMNLLKLPNYSSKEVMKAKLLYAVESGAGFELS